jgi:hypothetical protein
MKVRPSNHPNIAQTSFASVATLNSFPTKWRSHILQASHQWKRYLALAQPFEPKSIQLDKVRPFLEILLLNQENDNYLSHGEAAS